MVRLAPLDKLVAIASALRQLIWPIHPKDPGVDVVLVAGADLENAGNPVVGRPLEGSWLFALCIGQVLLPLDARIVGHEDEALAKVLRVINCDAKDDRLAGARVDKG
jgi:hypothetical protein